MKPLLKKIISFFLLLGVALFIFFLGIFSYKNDNARKKIQAIYNLKNFKYSYYQKGKQSQPKSIKLLIPDESRKTIESNRDIAIKNGILSDDLKTKVKAQLVYELDTFDIKMRLKGDYADHWAGDKWSYRIYLKSSDRLFGMRTFSIQKPETRKNLAEWYFHNLLKKEGLIALKYDFISLTENETLKGIYAIEESYDKELIENNERRASPILKFDESILIDRTKLNSVSSYSQEELFFISKIDLFKGKKTFKSPLLYNQYLKGKELLTEFRNGSISASDAFDIEKAATLFALADLIGGHHALRWKNVRFYYNPVLNKLELIGFDSNSGNLITDIYYNKVKNKRVGMFDVLAWKELFFKDSNFIEFYISKLKEYSQTNYLTQFHKETKLEMDKALSLINKEDYMYRFDTSIYTRNASIIRNKIIDYEQSKNQFNKYVVNAQLKNDLSFGDNSIQINIKNQNDIELIPIGIFNAQKELISSGLGTTVYYNSEYQKIYINYTLTSPIDSTQLKTKRKNNVKVHKGIKLGYYTAFSDDTLYSSIEHYYLFLNQNKWDFEQHRDAYKIDYKFKKIIFNEGDWSFNSNIEFPSGFSVEVNKNTNITLNNRAILVCNGPLLIKGTQSQPVIIKSTDSSGTIIVIQSAFRSEIEYAKFINLSESYTSNWHVSGALNFYESDVTLKNVTIVNNHSEDALNTFRSNFIIDSMNFINIKSDAFDGDFCTGKISNSSFVNIGNDALDFSGSNINIANVFINHVGDKGISAGEKSILNCSKVILKNCELGLVSKDLSSLTGEDMNLDSVSVPIAVFQKKEMFGPASLTLTKYEALNFIEPYLIEDRSKVFVNSDSVIANSLNVTEVLYGAQYGKKSK